MTFELHDGGTFFDKVHSKWAKE